MLDFLLNVAMTQQTETNTVNLELITNSEQDGNTFRITGIPTGVWTEFRKQAKKLLPDKKNAWSSFITEAIASICSGKSKTFILTDIPNQAHTMFNEICEQVGLREDQVIASLYRSASTDKLHVLRIRVDDEPEEQKHVLVTMGVPEEAWAGWTKFASSMGVPVEEFMGHLLYASVHGNIIVNPQGPTQDGSPYTADQVRQGVEGIKAGNQPRPRPTPTADPARGVQGAKDFIRANGSIKR